MPPQDSGPGGSNLRYSDLLSTTPILARDPLSESLPRNSNCSRPAVSPTTDDTSISTVVPSKLTMSAKNSAPSGETENTGNHGDTFPNSGIPGSIALTK